MKAPRIIKYDQRHEDEASRRLKRPRYAQAPTDQNSRGWKSLKIRGDFHTLGVYQCLYEWAATLPIRGLLAGPDEPYTIDDIAVYTDIPFGDLERALEVLMSERVMWIDEVDWPIDPRLVHVTEHARKGKPPEVTSEIILPFSIDQDGDLFDQKGNALDPYAPLLDGRSIETRFVRALHKQNVDAPESAQPRDHNRNRNRNTKGNLNPNPNENPNGTETVSGGVSPPQDSGSDSGGAGATDRLRSSQVRFWPVVTPLLGRDGASRHPADSPQCNADRSVAQRWWDEVIWPDDGVDSAACAGRLDEFVKLAKQATSRKKPMAWLTTMVAKHLAQGVHS